MARGNDRKVGRTVVPFSCCLAAALSLGVIGCRPLDRGEVAGRVTLDGQPVQGAQVLFYSTNGSGHAFASGATDADGRYDLRYAPSFHGIITGDYKVVVVPAPPDEPPDDA